ncbi:hypothetical protein Emed_003867 [Eimeria media]
MDQSREEQQLSNGETQGQAGATESTQHDSLTSVGDLVTTQESTFLGSQKPASVHKPTEDEVAPPGKLPDTPCRGRPKQEDHQPTEDEVAPPGKLPDTPCRGRPKQEDHKPTEDEVAPPGKLPETPCRGGPKPSEHGIKGKLGRWLATFGAFGAALLGSSHSGSFLGLSRSRPVALSPPEVPHNVQNAPNPLPRIPEEIEGLE